MLPARAAGGNSAARRAASPGARRKELGTPLCISPEHTAENGTFRATALSRIFSLVFIFSHFSVFVCGSVSKSDAHSMKSGYQSAQADEDQSTIAIMKKFGNIPS